MIRIYSATGFVSEFWEKVKEHKTFKSAYESLEKENILIIILSEFVEIEK